MHKYIKNTRNADEMTAEEVAARLEELAEIIASISARQDAIEQMLSDSGAALTDEDGNARSVDEIESEIAELEKELAEADEEKRCLLIAKSARTRAARRASVAASGTSTGKSSVASPAIVRRTQASDSFMREHRTKIGAHELRSTLVSNGSLAKPTGVNGINDMFNPVSSIIDQVTVEDCTGMGSYEIAYVKSIQTASVKTDGTAQTATDTDFRKAKISPVLIGTLSYISREVAKQTPLLYEQKVQECALKALRQKVANLIISGNGASDGIFGIYNAKNTESTPEAIYDTLDITGNIGEDTLRKIVFSHGGDENVFGNCRLYLNKKDLIAFGDVRGTNEKKPVYEITPDGSNPNTGTITDGGLVVPYTICSGATSFSGATATAAGVPTILYGDPLAYVLGTFGDFEISVSEDYKFAEGLNTVRGEIMVGGNLSADKAFTVVRKKTAS